MDELGKRGGKLVYDPEFSVHRRPRPTLKAFGKMLLNYGRGRAEQFRLHPTTGSALNFVPPLFLAYLAALGGIAAAKPALAGLVAMPLIPYGLALLGQTVMSAAKFGLGRGVAALPFVGLPHPLYGAGFWKGLFTRPAPATSATIGGVELEIIRR